MQPVAYLGLFIIALTLLEAFETVVLPRRVRIGQDESRGFVAGLEGAAGGARGDQLGGGAAHGGDYRKGDAVGRLAGFEIGFERVEFGLQGHDRLRRSVGGSHSQPLFFNLKIKYNNQIQWFYKCFRHVRSRPAKKLRCSGGCRRLYPGRGAGSSHAIDQSSVLY